MEISRPSYWSGGFFPQRGKASLETEANDCYCNYFSKWFDPCAIYVLYISHIMWNTFYNMNLGET